MTPIVSHTVRVVLALPDALILKDVAFGATQGGPMAAPGNTARRPWLTPWSLIALMFFPRRGTPRK